MRNFSLKRDHCFRQLAFPNAVIRLNLADVCACVGRGSIPWNHHVRFHIVWDQHLFRTNHIPLSLRIAFPADHNWLYNPASSIILTADPCLMAMPDLTMPQAFDCCSLSCLIGQLKMIYKWSFQCNWGLGRECSMCCSIKNACPSTGSFAAAFNSKTGLFLSWIFFFLVKYYFTINPSKFDISGNHSRNVLLMLGTSSLQWGGGKKEKLPRNLEPLRGSTNSFLTGLFLVWESNLI